MHEFTSFAVSVDEGVAHIEFNRPEQANAFNRQMWHELGAVMRAVDATPGVRVAVLSGRGKHFTAGIDLGFLAEMQAELAPLGPGRRQEQLLVTIRELQATVSAIEDCRKPVIAAIHGACLGGGIDISSACDLRYASAEANFAVKEIDVAIVADLGTLQRLPRLIGDGRARELALTGRHFDATTAAQWGFVSEVLPDPEALRAHALTVARTLAGKSPLALRGTKETLNYSRDHTVAEGLAFVAARNAALLFAPDIAEAIAARSERREPRFDD